jgi:sigma-B regulation protein RsbU (phosphoserine phosphatase)
MGERLKGLRASAAVASHPLFAGLTEAEVTPWLQRFESRSLRRGELLIAAGQENPYLYILISGRLEVHMDRPNAKNGIPVEAGECTGELSVIDGRPTTAYVVARTDAQALAIHRDLLWGELMSMPLVARNFMRLLSERFRARSDLMREALEQKLRLQQMTRELEIARNIQSSMLPPVGPICRRCPSVDLAAVVYPAKELGGDFYDAFPLDARYLCLAVGDVSGKGVPAALFMVRTMTQLRAEVLAHRELGPAIQGLNAALCRDNPTCMFATLLVLLLDTGTGRMRYVNGGHHPAIYQPLAGRARYLDQPPGILLGIEENAVFEVAEHQLDAGDALLLYTDGVNEAVNPRHEEFTHERLLSLVQGRLCHRAAVETTEAIQAAVAEFAREEPQFDDITIAALRYLG